MFTIDTNVLVYAHREEFGVHDKAKKLLNKIAQSYDPWVLLWPCIYEFIRIITHPKLFHPPTPVDLGLEAVKSLHNACTAILGETKQHHKWFMSIISETKCKGNHVFDAHIAALMREHGIDEIITSDKDFYQFSWIKVIKPF